MQAMKRKKECDAKAQKVVEKLLDPLDEQAELIVLVRLVFLNSCWIFLQILFVLAERNKSITLPRYSRRESNHEALRVSSLQRTTWRVSLTQQFWNIIPSLNVSSF